ncbi:hypothetical protein E1B28_005218 [Marasmius oreades]|uniref:Uncharacterized protein n=1 Tax=Marasmius oreades TaxID=181124 RepID=A0A9P7V0A6_9AGAR|nr:uncharacterized protein E1B28_005218 [Marasmius oreades]KAG7097907.1 hypothetical protein E1B28_005218 [Marasmius oreades]
MNAASFLKRQQRTTTRRNPSISISSLTSTASTSTASSLLSSCSLLPYKSTPRKKAVPQLQIITEDSEDLFDSPRPSFSSGRSTPDRRRPKISTIRLAKRRSEEDILSNDSMLSVPRPAPRPPTPGSSSARSSRSASPASFSRSPSPLPRSATPSPDALHISFQFPHSPPRSYTSPSPFSSPSSISSGLPITPEESPASSPRFGPHLRSDSSPCSLTRLKTIKPLTIVKRNDLAFDKFFSSPISPSVSSPCFTDLEEGMTIEPISFALPTSPFVEKASCDPFVVVPSLQTPVSESEDSDTEEEFYASSISSLLTIRSSTPHKHDLLPRARPESLAPPPQPRCRVSVSLPDTPHTPASINESRKACFPSAQLDPAWSRRSFLIPSRPPPPPPISQRATSSSPGVPTLSRKSRPPSLILTKALPRSSVVPSDEGVDGSSIFSFYGISPFADSDYLATENSASSSDLSCGSLSSAGRSEASSLPTSPCSEVGEDSGVVVSDVDIDLDVHDLEVELDAFDLEFDVDLDHHQFDMEGDLKLPVSLPGSPVPFTPVEDGEPLAKVQQEDDEELERDPRPVLKSRWSSSTLSSVQLQSPRTPATSAVSKFKLYFRGNNHNNTTMTSTSPRTTKKKRGIVIVGPSASGTSATRMRRSTSASGSYSSRHSYGFSQAPKSPSRSTISSFSFDTPLSSPPLSPTTTSPSTMSPAALKRLGAEAAPPAALRRLGLGGAGFESVGRRRKVVRRTSLSSVESVGCSDEEGEMTKRRKPIPVEMFLRV